jgi:hypothetical protein
MNHYQIFELTSEQNKFYTLPHHLFAPVRVQTWSGKFCYA